AGHDHRLHDPLPIGSPKAARPIVVLSAGLRTLLRPDWPRAERATVRPDARAPAAAWESDPAEYTLPDNPENPRPPHGTRPVEEDSTSWLRIPRLPTARIPYCTQIQGQNTTR